MMEPEVELAETLAKKHFCPVCHKPMTCIPALEDGPPAWECMKCEGVVQ